jgi:hypothetical protein
LENSVSGLVQLQLNRHQQEVLEEMVGLGLYGSSKEDAIIRILDQRFSDFKAQLSEKALEPWQP